jgi:hypothetical protein
MGSGLLKAPVQVAQAPCVRDPQDRIEFSTMQVSKRFGKAKAGLGHYCNTEGEIDRFGDLVESLAIR